VPAYVWNEIIVEEINARARFEYEKNTLFPKVPSCKIALWPSFCMLLLNEDLREVVLARRSDSVFEKFEKRAALRVFIETEFALLSSSSLMSLVNGMLTSRASGPDGRCTRSKEGHTLRL